MSFLGKFLLLFGWLSFWFSHPHPLEAPTNLSRTQSRGLPVTILTPQDGEDRRLSRYHRLLEDAITARYMVSSLYVQIGVLNFQWLTTASAIGIRQTSVSLTLAMPRGRLLRMHRCRKDSSESRSILEATIREFVQPSQPMIIQAAPPELPWYRRFLTRG